MEDEKKRKLTMFREMISCCSDIGFWIYDEQMQLVETTCEDASAANVHATYEQEQRLLKMMEEGNLDYKKYAGSIANVGMYAQNASVRQLKNLAIIHVALCTRAAIKGGLEPEIAYTLSDNYINSIEASSRVEDVAGLNSTMQDDFVRRVHRCRRGNGLSPQIQKCCGYIEMNLNRKLSVEELAGQVGYSGSHLSTRFKAETGMTIKEYTLHCRIERAKVLLRSGSEPVQEIGDSLGFGSQSYFAEKFRKLTGMTPLEYRNRRTE
ncbi:MAG: AraC family transcriptional regulator [Lachnospiraceae bacterium]|nr:AraC family transcriptional regulator [Lachnospiraceae bacterium]